LFGLGYTTTTLAASERRVIGPATGTVTLGYHIQVLTAGKTLNVVLVDDANYNLVILLLPYGLC
jgi:hypothetical protein